jgi:hypothetical protein
MKKLLLTQFILLSSLLAMAQQSDPEGVKKANRMIEKLGGHEIWGTAKHLYVEERVFPLTISGPLKAEFWRGYNRPDHLEKFQGPDTERAEFWDGKSGWTSSNGTVTITSEEDLVEERKGAQQEPYQIYHRLGKRDSTLVVKLVGKNRLDFYERNGRKLCWIIIDNDCAPVSWGNIYRNRLNQHVYGPLKKFGDIYMPAWGASIDGNFRFEYVQVKPLKEEFTPPPAKSKQ